MAGATRRQRRKQHQNRTEKSCRAPNRRCRLHTCQIIRSKVFGANLYRPAANLESKKKLPDAPVPSLNFFCDVPWGLCPRAARRALMPKAISFCPLQKIYLRNRLGTQPDALSIFSAVKFSHRLDGCWSGKLTKVRL